MNPEKAFETLTQALNVATMKGAFNLDEAGAILTALQVLKPNQPQTEVVSKQE